MILVGIKVHQTGRIGKDGKPIFCLTIDPPRYYYKCNTFIQNGDSLEVRIISWDQDTVDYISKHGVSPEEVENLLFNDDELPVIMRGREGRYLTYGKTQGGRYLLVVWVMKYRKTKIITARDMTDKEKQFYKRAKK